MKLLTLKKLSKELALASLFSGRDGTITNFEALAAAATYPACTGGYKRSMLERDNHAFPYPVWYVSRHDPAAVFAEDRRYIRLCCIHDSILTIPHLTEYRRCLLTWKSMLIKDGHPDVAKETQERIDKITERITASQAERSAPAVVIPFTPRRRLIAPNFI